MAARPRLHRMMMSGLPTIVLPLTPLDMMAARPRLHRRRLLTLLPLLKTLVEYSAGRWTWQVMHLARSRSAMSG